jgi:hypothetical protein
VKALKLLKSATEHVLYWLTFRRLKRAYLARSGGGVTLEIPAEWSGATESWSPLRMVSLAGPGTLELSAEELAAADLKPMLDDFHRRMAAAFRTFDAGMLAPMRTTHAWHVKDGECCERCAEYRARNFGPIGERFGIRSFRIDTPTAEYRIYSPHNIQRPATDLVVSGV